MGRGGLWDTWDLGGQPTETPAPRFTPGVGQGPTFSQPQVQGTHPQGGEGGWGGPLRRRRPSPPGPVSCPAVPPPGLRPHRLREVHGFPPGGRQAGEDPPLGHGRWDTGGTAVVGVRGVAPRRGSCRGGASLGADRGVTAGQPAAGQPVDPEVVTPLPW